MLTFDPIVDEALCVAYVAQTHARWHDGVARPEWADCWEAAHGGLTADERRAAETLRDSIRGLGDGCRAISHAAWRPHELAHEYREAFAVLKSRAAATVDAAREGMNAWRHALGANRPPWFAAMCERLDAFFGIDEDVSVRVYLLPGPPRSNCGNGDMFVERGATTLSCSGMPPDDEGLFLILLHETAHSAHQPRVLSPLVAQRMNAATRADLNAAFDESPISVMGGDLSSVIGEYVIHSLIPFGALREACGLESRDEHWRLLSERAASALPDPDADHDARYTAWVMWGAARLLPMATEYVRDERPMDADFVDAALDAFADIHREWRSSRR
ncbi:hypothetical protein CMK11_17310 [Candidatus Poribacteria bacterium]|jgi:hypothetical protein|nr:hypothetical protein [Candidatus Poribacteria bacterium]